MTRVVLITGSSTGGIGYALCEEFATKGCKVYATARNTSKIADFPGTLPVQVEKLELDVNDEESIRKALGYVEEKEGRLDVLVNNAGITAPGPLVDVPIELAKEVYETNTFSILRMCRAAVPLMAKHKAGNIINVGSIVGETPVPWSGVYSSSKAAVRMISDILAMELSPFNITVTHLAPGAIKSNIVSNSASRVTLSPASLYLPLGFWPFIQKRVDASQGGNAMDTKEFARRVVGDVLGEGLGRWGGRPRGYLSLGGYALVFSLMRWLPRGVVLWLTWRRFSPRS